MLIIDRVVFWLARSELSCTYFDSNNACMHASGSAMVHGQGPLTTLRFRLELLQVFLLLCCNCVDIRIT